MDLKIIKIQHINLYGLSTELTTSQNMNYKIISNFWVVFNAKIKSFKFTQNTNRNWKKYGITYKLDDKYYYFVVFQQITK